MQFTLTTGEIFDLSTNEGLIEANRALKHYSNQLKELERLITNKIKELAADGDYELNKFYKIEKKTIERRGYTISALRQFFDEDQLSECLSPINKKVDELAKEILTTEERRELDGSMIVVSKYDTFKIKES